MPVMFDVFVSYAHKDEQPVLALKAALDAAGLRVWLDRTNVEAFERIDDRVASGIANSRALLAWYSRNYASSRPCQWELSAAWVCENGARVLCVNPETGSEHIAPPDLLDRLYGNPDDLAALATRVANALAPWNLAIGDGASFTQPMHYGRQLAGSNHFVGRTGPLWEINTGLSPAAGGLLSRTQRSVVQLRGLGGVGKSLLAEEYALRFGPAYPGGIFWLKAFGNSDDAASGRGKDRDAERERQIAEFASAFRIPVEGRPPAEIRAALGQALAAGPRSLWIVDDMPSQLSADALEAWLSPHKQVPTLITTRDRSHSSLGSQINLDVLSDAESLELFEAHRPLKVGEADAGQRLLAALGHHALAVEVAAAYLADYPAESIAGFLAGLEDPAEDVLEQAADLADVLPQGHSPSIVSTLNASIGQLSESARDLLCLAACVAVAPMPMELMDATFARLSADGSAKTARRVAAKEVERLSLARMETTPPEALSVHTLVARTAWRHASSQARREKVRAAALCGAMDVIGTTISLGAILRQPLAITHARALSATPACADGASLLVRVANTDLLRGDLPTADSLARRALAYCESALGDESIVTWFARSGVAMVVMAQGDTATAQQMLSTILPVFENRLPPGDIYRIGAQQGLAFTYAVQGDFAAARRHGDAGLAAVIASYGPTDPLTLNAKTMAAQLLLVVGDIGVAQALQRDVAAARAQIADSADADTLMEAYLAARGMLASGQIEAVAPVIERAATTFAQEFGPDNLYTLNAQLSLLCLLGNRHDAPAMRALAGDLIPRLTRAFGAANPATLQAQVVGAAAVLVQGDAHAARTMLTKPCAQLEAALGPTHIEVLAARTALAYACLADGDVPSAMAILAVDVPAAEARYGAGNPVTLNARMCLGFCLSESGDSAGEARVQGEIVAAREAVLGSDDAQVLADKVSLAQTLSTLGQHQPAIDLLRAVLPRADATLPPGHPTTLHALSCLAGNLHSLGEVDEGVACWGRLLAAQNAAFGSEDAQTMLTAACLFNVRWNQGNAPSCRELFFAHLQSVVRRDPQSLAPYEQSIRERVVAHTDWLGRAAPVA